MLTEEWVTEIRYRAEHPELGLCPKEHTVHHDESGREVWMTCGDEELGRLILPPSSMDQSDDIRYFLRVTDSQHQGAIARAAIISLVDECRALDDELRGVKGG